VKEFSYRSKHDLAAVAAAMATVAVTVFKLSLSLAVVTATAIVLRGWLLLQWVHEGLAWLDLAWLLPAATVTVALWLWLRSKLQYFLRGLAAATAELQRVA